MDYQVIVVGSEPEGISAAVAAAEMGARTMLITADLRLGGLFVLGELNVLDLRTQPFNYQRGLFERWWRRVGQGSAFDVGVAERAFEAMLAEADVTVLTGEITEPVLDASGRVTGVRFGDTVAAARQIIDATADMDFAAAAGAGFTTGFEAFNYPERMADTLVFAIEGVDWATLRHEIEQRGRTYARIDQRVAWGSFGGVPTEYRPVEPGLRLRGLNLGRQDDGTVLVNALLIYGVDPFDPQSRQEALAKGSREAERIVAYFAETLPGFSAARFGGVAERLYIRESRHLEAHCTLRVDDVLDHVVTELDVAAGGYPLDVQTLTPHDNGFVYGRPDIYGVQLCVTVPAGPTSLWVVGRAAGFDPLAASSARVVPFGMALAEAVGVAAAFAANLNLTPSELLAETTLTTTVRQTLTARGAFLPDVTNRNPAGSIDHPHYLPYRTLLARGLAVGGYNNDPRLDEPGSTLSFIYLLSNVGQRFLASDQLGSELLDRYGEASGPLTPEVALAIAFEAGCLIRGCPSRGGWPGLVRAGLAPEGFAPESQLTRGEMYALAALFAQLGSEGDEASPR